MSKTTAESTPITANENSVASDVTSVKQNTVDPETEQELPDSETVSEEQEVVVDESNVITDTDRLLKYLNNLSSYEANFLQQRYSTSRELLDSSSGRFVLSRPSQFIWQTYTPFEQKIMSNGKVLWTIDVDLEQVIINDVDERIENAPIYLLARNQADLANLFNVKHQPVAENNEYFVLNPKDESGAFEGVRLGFVDGILSSIELNDSLGQLTLVTMTNIRNNPILDISQFEYTPDEDFDIIDSRTTSESD